eukprot:scaffold44999_cov59-Phaeocystis_antarctica.AAC.6
MAVPLPRGTAWSGLARSSWQAYSPDIKERALLPSVDHEAHHVRRVTQHRAAQYCGVGVDRHGGSARHGQGAFEGVESVVRLLVL